MYIKADQEKQKRLSIAIVVIVGFVLIHQSFSIPSVIAQTNQNNVNAENLSSKIHEIELAVKVLHIFVPK